jgi:hypothetical protein
MIILQKFLILLLKRFLKVQIKLRLINAAKVLAQNLKKENYLQANHLTEKRTAFPLLTVTFIAFS